ncbi:MAG TPA: recombinase family protein [Pseudonocardiaceae bacterium]|jgi:DNA invertase Pin-like site-specific DNA recombinase
MHRLAAIYCRISRDRAGAGLGVDRQEQDCRELAARLGWAVTVVHTDNDLSAYSGKRRPGYRALLADVKAGRADAVLAWHNDRLHRSTSELEEYIDACGAVPTHFVKAGQLDLSTASGRMTARITGAVARHEVEHMIERQKAAKLQAGQAGEYRGGRRPFGYEPDGVTVRPAEATAVLDATRRVLHGETLASIAREWNSRGITSSAGSPWTSISLHRVLIRPRNAAIVEHEGKPLAKAKWPAIVPEDAWAAVCLLLGDPSRRRARSADRRWLGSGLFLCGVCNDGITTMRSASTSGSTGGPKRPTYRCKAGAHLARVAEPVDQFITDVVIGRLSQPDARLLLRTAPDVDTAALVAESEALRVRNGGLAEMFTDGVITRGELEVQRARIQARQAEIAAEMAGAAVGSPLEGFADAEDVAAAWEAATVSRRKAVIDTLMVVTLLPAPRGRRPGGGYFSTDSVRKEWRQ